MNAGRHDDADFERQKRIPRDACREIATAVLRSADGVRGCVLEIGAGGGGIGFFLAEGGRYAGLDASRPMLGRFAARASGRAPLVEGDAAGRWPLRSASAALVFGARIFHILDALHVAREARRVLASQGVLLAGRVLREKEDPREILRRSLAEALARHGVPRRDPREGSSGPFEALFAFGAERIPAVTVTRWSVPRRPAASLETWRLRAGLPGAPELDAENKRAVLAEVEASWRAAFGDPDAPVHSDEWFELEGARVP